MLTLTISTRCKATMLDRCTNTTTRQSGNRIRSSSRTSQFARTGHPNGLAGLGHPAPHRPRSRKTISSLTFSPKRAQANSRRKNPLPHAKLHSKGVTNKHGGNGARVRGEKVNLHPRSHSQMAIIRDKPTAAMVTAAARSSPLARVNDWLNNERALGYVLLVPALVLLLVFVAYPFFFGTYISLTDARIGNPGTFIGVQNFIDLWSDPIFRQTVGNSFFYTIVTTIFKLPLGILMA